jgi:hypothetical protein
VSTSEVNKATETQNADNCRHALHQKQYFTLPVLSSNHQTGISIIPARVIPLHPTTAKQLLLLKASMVVGIFGAVAVLMVSAVDVGGDYQGADDDTE